MSEWVNLELDDESKLDAIPIMTSAGKPVMPEYPYGLKLCLHDEQIEKLDLEDEAEAGDYVVFKARACVTCSSSEKMADGSKSRRVELQIEDIKILGVEDEPDEANEPAEPADTSGADAKPSGLKYKSDAAYTRKATVGVGAAKRGRDALPKDGY